MLPAIFGISGQTLTDAERDLFSAKPPLGFILFRRNIDNPEQVKKLTQSLRELTGRPDTPILIDQEGGRVQRLRPPHWVDLPHARALGDLYKHNPGQGIEATKLHTQIIAGQLTELGINVVCAPVLDVPVEGAHDVIGKRAFGTDLETITTLGDAMAREFLECGITPILKHIPGHGRAEVDSHDKCPVVETDKETLYATDFMTFKHVAETVAPEKLWAMTAHIVYTALDAEPVSVSKTAINFIRTELGVTGLIMPDAVEMEALGGSIAERALATIKAGCDVTLHCSGKFDDIKAITDILPPISDDAMNRYAQGEKARRAGAARPDWREAYKKLRDLIPQDDAYVYTQHQALNVA